jgi:hypothetical protein
MTTASNVPARQPWEKQPGESDAAFRAWRTYRDMEEGRSIRRAAQQLGKAAITLEKWSRRHRWQARLDAWLYDQDRRLLEARETERMRLDREHAEHGRYVRIRAMQRLAGDEASGVEALDWNQEDLVAVLAALRTGAGLERQALGLSVNAGQIEISKARRILNEAVTILLEFVPEEKRASAIRALQAYVEGAG